MHDHDGGLGVCYDACHARILLQAPDVIDRNDTTRERASRHRCLRRVDRHRDVECGHRREHLIETGHLLGFVDGFCAWSGRLGANVDDIAAVRDHAPDMVNGVTCCKESSTVEERVRRYVEDTHDERTRADCSKESIALGARGGQHHRVSIISIKSFFDRSIRSASALPSISDDLRSIAQYMALRPWRTVAAMHLRRTEVADLRKASDPRWHTR